jgi:hypothetical protein
LCLSRVERERERRFTVDRLLGPRNPQHPTVAPTRRSVRELYMRHRTVEWHLRQVYTKLGINSRKGLGGALRSPYRETTPV